MANKKITELSANTSPSFSDVLPIVNSGTTKKLSLSGLTDFLSTTDLKFQDAPIDGNRYGRKDGNWSIIPLTGITPTLQEVTTAGFITNNEIDVKNILIRDTLSDNYASFYTSAMTDNRFYTFPNSDGTLATEEYLKLNYFPLTGTISGNPVTGSIETLQSTKSIWAKGAKYPLDYFAVNIRQDGVEAIYNDEESGLISGLKISDNATVLEQYSLTNIAKVDVNAGGVTIQTASLENSSFGNIDVFNGVIQFSAFNGIDNQINILFTRENGFGIGIASNNMAFLKTDNITIDRTFQFPDANGTILTTSGTVPGNPITGSFEFTGSNKIYADDSISTGSIIYGESAINIESYMNDDASYASLTVNNNGSIIINTAISGSPSNGLTGQYDYSNNITDLDYPQKIYVDNIVASSKPYQIYTALLTQTGTNAPTATILENTLGTISFTYIGSGHYRINSTGLFTNNKTFIIFGNIVNNASGQFLNVTALGEDININTIPFVTKVDDVQTNNALLKTPIEIRVYN